MSPEESRPDAGNAEHHQDTNTSPMSSSTDIARGWQWGDDPNAIPYTPHAWKVRAGRRSERNFLSLAVLSPVPRAGSTLLQRLCNARKKNLIWGEHNGVLTQFVDIYRQAAYFSLVGKPQREQFFNSAENPNVWIANMCCDLEYLQNAVVASARTLLNTMYSQHSKSHNIIGFKEFRYGAAEVELLQQCYPKLNVLLLVRHPCNTWNSTPRDWYASLDEWTALWNSRTREFLALAASAPRCHFMRYEDLIQKDPRCLELITRVARIGPRQIEDVLTHKIGSAHQGLAEQERRQIEEQCAEVMALLDYH